MQEYIVSDHAQPPYLSYIQVAERVEKIFGHLHPGQENILFDLAGSTPNPGDILEVGAFKGRSTAALGFACLGTMRKVHTIDTFRGRSSNTDEMGDEFYLGEFLKNMDECGLIGVVCPMVGYSQEYWRAWDKPLAMLFLDGGHNYETARGDLDAFFPWLRPGGILAMHDVWRHTLPERDTERVWQEITSELEDIRLFHNLAWGWKKGNR